MNIILVLCEVVPLVKSSSLKLSLSIMTVPALRSSIFAGHTGCLSNTSNAQDSWYGIAMHKSEEIFKSSFLLVNTSNSKEKSLLSWLLSFATKVWIHSFNKTIHLYIIFTTKFLFCQITKKLNYHRFWFVFSTQIAYVWWSRHVI